MSVADPTLVILEVADIVWICDCGERIGLDKPVPPFPVAATCADCGEAFAVLAPIPLDE